ncbi:MAG: LysR family transcriptional regulator [Gammaproteobacteria bacterium]|nr:LysR family transcriptional regulator [Gammaproteobacteria bacterium]
MNWHDLRAFVAVAEQQSFSKAAGQLHISQPAVSKRIQALESELAAKLFDRVGKRIYLTDAGALLRPRAVSMLQEMTDTQRLLRNLKSEVGGVLRLATSHHVGLHRLAPALKSFTQRYPDVRLDIRFEDSEAAHELVRRANSELAVVTLDPNGDVELEYQTLWDDPLCFVVAADHPLAAVAQTTLNDLANHPVIMPGLATYTGRIVAEVFSDASIALDPAMSTNYLETISMLVGTGLGWSVLPASMVADGLVKLTTNAPPLHRTLGCVTHPARTLSNAARAFQEVTLEFRDAD